MMTHDLLSICIVLEGRLDSTDNVKRKSVFQTRSVFRVLYYNTAVKNYETQY